MALNHKLIHMRILVILTLSLIFTSLTGNHAFAQQRLTSAGKIYHIPEFRNDTIAGKHLADKYIGQVKRSKYDLEIRCTVLSVTNMSRTPVVLIKGNKDSLFAESYLFIFGPQHGSPHIIHKKLAVSKYVDSVFRILIANNVFDMKDHQMIEDSLKAHKVAADPPKAKLDGPPFYTIEVKLHNQYHSYFISEPRIKYHIEVPEFVKADTIKDLFRDLYEEIEKTGEGL